MPTKEYQPGLKFREPDIFEPYRQARRYADRHERRGHFVICRMDGTPMTDDEVKEARENNYACMFKVYWSRSQWRHMFRGYRMPHYRARLAKECPL